MREFSLSCGCREDLPSRAHGLKSDVIIRSSFLYIDGQKRLTMPTQDVELKSWNWSHKK